METDAVIALSAVIIALAAFFVSLWQAFQTVRHNKLSVKPHLRFDTVTAPIPPAILPLCDPEFPVSLVVLNGTGDPLVPYYGGHIRVFRQQRGEVLSTDETIKIWLTKNRCTPEPKVTEPPDLTKDGTRVTKTEYNQCGAGSKVVLYRIEGGGHTWPGGRQYLPVRLIGRTSRDINACDEIWSFLRGLN